MTDKHIIRLQRIQEHRIDGKRLGRHIEHDARSLAYGYPYMAGASLRTVQHPRRIAVLDQGMIGSCTGNAAVGAIGTHPLFGRLPEGHPVLNERLAVKVYARATVIDGVPGTYPTEDTGSTGLAVAKVLKNMGQILGYQHTFDIDTALQAIVAQPILVGTNWHEGMDSPDRSGLVTASGGVRGGHEYVVDGIDVETRRVWATNSWGLGYGIGGRFSMSWDTFADLLDEGGDVVVPIKLPKLAVTGDDSPESLLQRVWTWLNDFL